MNTITFPKNLKLILIYIFIVISFLPLFHNNILKPYFPPSFTDNASSDASAVYDFYLKVTGPLFHYNNKLGLGNLWKMVSPVNKNSYWVDWYAENPEGNWNLLELPNLSPQYRKQRSVLNVWLWDFKLARFENRLNNQKIYRERYADYLCKHLRSNGQRLSKVRAESVQKSIPLPYHAAGWSWTNVPVSKITKFEVYSCS